MTISSSSTGPFTSSGPIPTNQQIHKSLLEAGIFQLEDVPPPSPQVFSSMSMSSKGTVRRTHKVTHKVTVRSSQVSSVQFSGTRIMHQNVSEQLVSSPPPPPAPPPPPPTPPPPPPAPSPPPLPLFRTIFGEDYTNVCSECGSTLVWDVRIGEYISAPIRAIFLNWFRRAILREPPVGCLGRMGEEKCENYCGAKHVRKRKYS